MLLNATIGFFQEYRAEKATEALQKLVPANAKVVRDGEVTIVAAADLVPGDIIVLEEGDSISADARVVRQYELSTNNIALTGESDAVRKTADPIIEEELATINMPNLVFMGTSVASGTGRAVVFATGLKTEFGRIYSLTAGVSEEKSPLMREIDTHGADRLDHRHGLRRRAVLHGQGRSGSTGSAPCCSPSASWWPWSPRACRPPCRSPCRSACSAWPRRRRSSRASPASRLSGSTNVIATDKTGTLTKAEMTLKTIWADGDDIEVTGAGYAPDGDFVVGDTTLPKEEARRRLEPLLRAMTFCNDAKVLAPSDDKGWRVIGDATEGCLLVAAQKAGFDLQAELIERPKIYELPFESVRKRMSVVHVEGDGQHAFVKGAPSETLGRCTHMRLDGSVVPLTDELREQHHGAERRDVATGAARARRLRAQPAERAHRLHAGHRRDRPHLPRPRRHDRPAAPRSERGGRGGARRRHPHHHGHRRLRPHGRGHRPPHRHRARRQARARDHRRRPRGDGPRRTCRPSCRRTRT